MPNSETQFMELLKDTLIKNAHLVIALPTFDADSTPPTVAFLLGKYPSPPPAPSSHFGSPGGIGIDGGGLQNGDSYTGHDGTNVDISNMLTNHDLQYQLWQKHQQQRNSEGDSISTTGTTAPSVTKLSVSDAFGVLPEVEDRPLPSFQSPPPPPPPQNTPYPADRKVDNDVRSSVESIAQESNDDTANTDDDGDFVAFDSAPAQPTTSDATSNDHFQPSDNMVGDSNISLDKGQETTGMADDDDDDFGGFESIVANTQAAEDGNVFPPKNNNDFGEFGAGANAENMHDTKTMLDDEDDFGTFGGFSETVNNDAVLGMAGPVLSVSDAFDSLVDSHVSSSVAIGQTGPFGDDHIEKEQCVDELDMFKGSAETENQDITNEYDATNSSKVPQSAVVDEEDDNNIGNFENAIIGANSFGESSQEVGLQCVHMDSQMEENGVFKCKIESESLNNLGNGVVAKTNSTHSLSVFDALVDIQDAPLPALGSFKTSTANLDDEAQPSIIEPDEDFGDFEGVDKQGSPEMNSTKLTGMNTNSEIAIDVNGGAHDDTPPSSGASFGTNNIDDDDFGDFEGTGENHSSNDGDFVLRETTKNGELFEENIVDGSVTDEKLSAFDAFGNSQDANLPSLDNLVAKSEENESSNGNNCGDFNQTDPSSGNGAPISDYSQSAFGAFGDVQDAPLSPLKAIPMEVEADGDDFGDFGDFEGTVVSSTETGTGFVSPDSVANNALPEKMFHCSNNVSVIDDTIQDGALSAFDAFGDVQDAPLPPLGAFPTIADDTAKLSENEVGDDDFGDFEGTANAGFDSPGADDNAEASDNLFLGNNNNAVCDDVDQDATLSAFDAFGDMQDAPLPPLGDFSASATEVDNPECDDSFGNFEGTNQTSDDANADTELASAADTEEKAAASENLFYENNYNAVSDDALQQHEALSGFNSFGDVQNPPLPIFPSGHNNMDNPEDGGHDTARMDQIPNIDNGLPSFDAFGNVHDAPLPPLGAFSGSTKSAGDIADDDDFGDFEGIDVGTGFNSPNDDVDRNTATMSDSHQPSLEARSTSDNDLTMNENYGGDFGDFEGIDHSSVHADAGNIPPNVNDNREADDAPSAFDAFGDVQNTPLPTLGVFSASSDDIVKLKDDGEDFGDFGGTGQTSDDDDVGVMSPDTDGINEANENILPVFDAFGDVQNAPLPPFSASLGDGAELGEDADDFGDFSGISQTPANADIINSGGLPAFDAFGATHDAHVTSFGEFSTDPDQAAICDSDEFGNVDTFGKAGSNQASSVTTSEVAIVPSSFGAFSDSNDVPLHESVIVPSLEPLNDAVKPVQNNDVNFNNFEGHSSENDRSDENGVGPCIHETDGANDDFGNFEGMGGPSSDGLVTSGGDLDFNDHHDNQIRGAEDFGGFSSFGSAERDEQVQDAENVVDSDDFGDFSAFSSAEDDVRQAHNTVNDAELPSVDSKQENGADAFDDKPADWAGFESTPPKNDNLRSHDDPYLDLRKRFCNLKSLPQMLVRGEDFDISIVDCFDRCAAKEAEVRFLV